MNKSRIPLFCLVLAMCFGTRAYCQNMELINSINNPDLAEGSEVMAFEALKIDAGLLNEDSGISTYVYRWTNKGSQAISITDVRTSCSCALPEYAKEEVAPGQSAEIRLDYNPKGRPGGFTRRLYVYSSLSSEKPSAVLVLQGETSPSLRPTFDYPVAFGPLLLKRASVRMKKGEKQVVRIECMNAGEEPLNISAEKALLPEGLSVDDLHIAGGEIADIVIRYVPKGNMRVTDIPLILTGLDMAPSQRTIKIEFQ